MAYPDWNLIQEPDPLDAASLNTPLAAIAGAINALEPDAIQPRGLRREHLPDVIPTPGVGTANIDGSTAMNYTNLYPGYDTSTIAGVGPGAGTGWRVINDGSSGLQIDVAGGLVLNMGSADRVAGLLILLNIELVLIEEAGKGAEDDLAAFCVCWRDSGGTRTVLPHTERFESAVVADSAHRHILRDVSIRTLLHGGLLPTTSTAVYGIDALVAFHESGGTASGQNVRLRRGNMTVIPIHAADVL